MAGALNEVVAYRQEFQKLTHEQQDRELLWATGLNDDMVRALFSFAFLRSLTHASALMLWQLLHRRRHPELVKSQPALWRGV